LHAACSNLGKWRKTNERKRDIHHPEIMRRLSILHNAIAFIKLNEMTCFAALTYESAQIQKTRCWSGIDAQKREKRREKAKCRLKFKKLNKSILETNISLKQS
jgi:hypothetical protein